MNKHVFALAAVVTLAHASEAFSQGEEVVFQEPVQRSQAGMYEDIEVFRRILSDGLNRLIDPVTRQGSLAHTTAGVLQTDPWRLAVGDGLRMQLGGTPHAFAPSTSGQQLIASDGVYLKGYGVVMNTVFPWHHQKPVADGPAAFAKAVSDWERIRGEMRGDKSNAAAAPPKESPAIADVVLKRLADNGKHFSHLVDDEKLTVVVTLRPLGACANCHTTGTPKVGAASTAAEDTAATLLRSISEGSNHPEARESYRAWQLAKTATAQDPLASASHGGDKRTEASNYSRLGELRQKQGRLKDAMSAYQKAVEIYQGILGEQEKPKESDLSSAQEVASKLSQVYAQMGEQARALETRSVFLQNAFATAAIGNKSMTAGQQRHTSRLIISAPKKLLDQVGNGKITFEEFKKGATVELVNLAPPENAGAAPKKP
jgi:tetratricopeptide (TPR) repeat protein